MPEEENTRPEDSDSNEEQEDQAIRENGSLKLTGKSGKHGIRLLTIIGEIEGHDAVSGNTKATKYEHLLPRLAEGSNTLFELLLHIRCRDILDEVKKEVLYGALRSDRWKERFELLAGKGWKKSSQNHKEAIRLTDDYLKILGTKKYAPGRRGHLDQINDRARLRFIRVYEQKKKL